MMSASATPVKPLTAGLQWVPMTGPLMTDLCATPSPNSTSASLRSAGFIQLLACILKYHQLRFFCGISVRACRPRRLTYGALGVRNWPGGDVVFHGCHLLMPPFGPNLGHVQGKDCGEIKLRLTYVPLARVNPLVGQRGNFFVYPKKGRDFPRMVPKSAKSTNPYYIGKIGSEKKTGNTLYNTTVRPHPCCAAALHCTQYSMLSCSLSWRSHLCVHLWEAETASSVEEG